MATTKKAVESAEKAPETAKKAPRSTKRTVSCAPYAALNVRKQPEAGAEIVKMLPNGVEASVEAEKDGWCRLSDGSGYVMAEYLA